MKKNALDFINIISTDYIVNMGPQEKVAAVKLYLGSSIKDLVNGVDYQINNGIFKIINSSIQQFDKIEVLLTK